jgi:hypothetical protein
VDLLIDIFSQDGAAIEKDAGETCFMIMLFFPCLFLEIISFPVLPVLLSCPVVSVRCIIQFELIYFVLTRVYTNVHDVSNQMQANDVNSFLLKHSESSNVLKTTIAIKRAQFSSARIRIYPQFL